jgi:hypothetical protein
MAQNLRSAVGGYAHGRIFFSVDSFLQNPFCELNPQPGKLQQYYSKLIGYYREF